MNKIGLVLLSILVLGGCEKSRETQLREGMWRAVMEVQDRQELPFNFTLEKGGSGYVMEVYNAEEVLFIDEISIRQDSITIKMPVFEGYIAATFTDSTMKGNFIKESLDRIVPFLATHGDSLRFKPSKGGSVKVQGNWEVEFSKNSEDAYMAKGIFQQKGDRVTGTFRTNTGDYRYLEGEMQDDSLKLSTFDGAHVFLFLAKVTDSIMNGVFYSGNHFQEPFEGRRNENFELADGDSLTFVKEGFDGISFSFPDPDGKDISLEDPRFKDKVVLLQIMGTWCPNCLDESKFLTRYLRENNNDGLEVVALAFEYAKTEEAAFNGINRLKERLGISYPILLAQYGTSDKQTANEKLPMLNHILSYPTTIFIDKEGKVRKIHTGFNGPATGEKYTQFTRDFKEFVNTLLAE